MFWKKEGEKAGSSKSKDNSKENKDKAEEIKPISESLKKAISPSNQPVLMLRKVSKSYKDKLVLKDVDFDIFHKDIFGIIGMSGSGKTTIFQLMSGILNPQSGDVLVRNDLLFDNKSDSPDYVSVLRNQSRVKQNFGFASQIPSFYDHLTVEENLMFYGSLYGLKKKRIMENMEKLLRLVDLTEDRDSIAAELSGGMQRRLDIACSLIHEPKMLFLDEPTSDLDPVMRKQIWRLIKQINSQGTTIVIASHILDEVEQLCTKVAILHDRKILGHGTLKELKDMFKKGRIVKVMFDDNRYDALRKKLKKVKGVERTSEQDNELIVFVSGDDLTIRRVIKAVESCKERLVSLDVSDSTLTEIFERLTKKSDG
ncbi:MAG: ABC transporter ATP-binding protein [Candidatus Woesearchaeota archaeon]